MIIGIIYLLIYLIYLLTNLLTIELTNFLFRKILQTIGSRIFLIGLAGLFRYVLFLLPIMILMLEILVIIRSISDKSGLNSQNILQLVKITLLLVTVGITVKLVEMLPGFGYSILFLGATILFVSIIDPLLKLICPYLIKNLPQILAVLHQLESVESMFFNYTSSIIKEISSSDFNNLKIYNKKPKQKSRNRLINSQNRVEEIFEQNSTINSTQPNLIHQQQQEQDEQEYEPIPSPSIPSSYISNKEIT